MTDIDDDLDLDDTETDDGDGFVRVKRADLQALRKAQRRAAKLEKETAEWRREKAIAKAGLDHLRPSQIAALVKVCDGDDSPEALKAAADDLFGPPDTSTAEIADLAAAEADVKGAPPAASSMLTPDEVNGWPADRLMRLNTEHPTVFEALMRGETVPTPTAA